MLADRDPDAFAIREHHYPLAGLRKFERKRRPPAPEQRPVPGRNRAKRKNQHCNRRANGAGKHRHDAGGGCNVQREDRRRERGRSAQFENQQRRAAQARANTRLPLVPPKPNEFDIAVRMVILRAALGT